MNTRRVHIITMSIVACVSLGLGIAGAQTRPGVPSASAWTARLEALRPSQPLAYFELAEEVADAAKSPADKDLARHLFALAGALDPGRLGRSACLALADLESDDIAKRRLLALAGLLGGSQAGGDGLASLADASEGPPTGGPAALAVTEAFSRYRKGQGPQALTALKKSGATELLQHYERMIPGGLNRFLEDCKHYKGQLRPTLSSAEITRMLRFESAILVPPDQRTWSSELLLTDGRPLIEVDPDRIEESLGVDVTRPFYRGGRWVER